METKSNFAIFSSILPTLRRGSKTSFSESSISGKVPKNKTKTVKRMKRKKKREKKEKRKRKKEKTCVCYLFVYLKMYVPVR